MHKEVKNIVQFQIFTTYFVFKCLSDFMADNNLQYQFTEV